MVRGKIVLFCCRNHERSKKGKKEKVEIEEQEEEVKLHLQPPLTLSPLPQVIIYKNDVASKNRSR